MKQGKVTFENKPGSIYQQGTPLREVPGEIMAYIARKYPLEPITAALLEKAEREITEDDT